MKLQSSKNKETKAPDSKHYQRNNNNKRVASEILVKVSYHSIHTLNK